MVIRAALLALTLVAGLLGAAQPGVAESSDVTATIERQIEAFKADDFDQAFTFASPMIQHMFRTPERFGQMVRQGYPMVWRPAQVQYGDATTDSGVVRQTVLITDQQGVVHFFEYEMIRGASGWVINGVRRIQAPQVGV